LAPPAGSLASWPSARAGEPLVARRKREEEEAVETSGGEVGEQMAAVGGGEDEKKVSCVGMRVGISENVLFYLDDTST
jgi:hypothetical protein